MSTKFNPKVGTPPTLPNDYSKRDQQLEGFKDGADARSAKLMKSAGKDVGEAKEAGVAAAIHALGIGGNLYEGTKAAGRVGLDVAVATVAAAGGAINDVDAALQILQAGGYVAAAGVTAAAGGVVKGTEIGRNLSADGLYTASKGTANWAAALYQSTGTDLTATTRDIAPAPGAKDTSTKVFEQARKFIDVDAQRNVDEAKLALQQGGALYELAGVALAQAVDDLKDVGANALGALWNAGGVAVELGVAAGNLGQAAGKAGLAGAQQLAVLGASLAQIANEAGRQGVVGAADVLQLASLATAAAGNAIKTPTKAGLSVEFKPNVQPQIDKAMDALKGNPALQAAFKEALAKAA